MIIEITESVNPFKRFWLWLRGDLHTIGLGEQLHFKGIKSVKGRSVKEKGDFLIFPSNDPKDTADYGALCTYQISEINGNEAKLELLSYNVNR